MCSDSAALELHALPLSCDNLRAIPASGALLPVTARSLMGAASAEPPSTPAAGHGAPARIVWARFCVDLADSHSGVSSTQSSKASYGSGGMLGRRPFYASPGSFRRAVVGPGGEHHQVKRGSRINPH